MVMPMAITPQKIMRSRRNASGRFAGVRERGGRRSGEAELAGAERGGRGGPPFHERSIVLGSSPAARASRSQEYSSCVGTWRASTATAAN
jgi:hypothetical protein